MLLSIWSKNSASLACLCITDSLSHTTYLETNRFCLLHSKSVSIYHVLVFCYVDSSMGNSTKEKYDFKQNPKCQNLPKFQLGGCPIVVKTQSAKIYLNLNLRGGGVL